MFLSKCPITRHLTTSACRSSAQNRFSQRYLPDPVRALTGRVIMCEHVYKRVRGMSETLSIRIDAETKRRLDALSKRSKRSKSFLAAEAIAAYVQSEEWQLGKLQAGIAELESGQEVSHEKVSKW